MPIQAIIHQPAEGALKAAYRPIVFRVEAIRTGGANLSDIPPLVFCDIYIAPPGTNYTYFKSLSKTQSIQGGGTRYFEFDIQDAVQEALGFLLPTYGGTRIIDQYQQYVKTCQVYFRSSGLDVDGLLETEDIAPVQYTGNTSPTGGTGTASHIFLVLNATLQHYENQDLAAHLQAYAYNTVNGWSQGLLPVSHRPSRYYLTATDNDFFSVYVPADRSIRTLEILYRYINQNIFRTAQVAVQFPGFDDFGAPAMLDHFDTPVERGTVIYVPNGPLNLQAYFPGVNLLDVAEYRVRLKDAGDECLAESPTNVQQRYDEYIRVYFQNYLGTMDAMNFGQVQILHESKSDVTQRPATYPLDRSAHALRRFNIRSNDTYSVTSIEYEEDAQNWINELLDSPNAWIGVPDSNGLPAAYAPIVITDKKAEVRKIDDRYVYEVTVEFKLSHERITHRN